MARMQYEQAKGAVQQGEGAVEAASSVARESRVTAPFAGRVAARLVEAGDLAAPGRPLVMVESATGRRLVVQVPAGTVAASGLEAGQKLSVKIDGVAAELTGTVVEMSPGADPASHTYTATLELAGTPVATGLTGRATLDTAPRATVLVPESRGPHERRRHARRRQGRGRQGAHPGRHDGRRLRRQGRDPLGPRGRRDRPRRPRGAARPTARPSPS